PASAAAPSPPPAPSNQLARCRPDLQGGPAPSPPDLKVGPTSRLRTLTSAAMFTAPSRDCDPHTAGIVASRRWGSVAVQHRLLKTTPAAVCFVARRVHEPVLW